MIYDAPTILAVALCIMANLDIFPIMLQTAYIPSQKTSKKILKFS